MSDHIAALLHEMERHVLAGREERVAQIKDELAALGHKLSRKDAPAVETTAAPAAPETAAAPRAKK